VKGFRARRCPWTDRIEIAVSHRRFDDEERIDPAKVEVDKNRRRQIDDG
jgi:hypothetical protein